MSKASNKMNPFPGLRPFTQEEDYLFFGREEQTIELLQRLGSNRFVAVVGTSGSGKSSLVRCGLLSELLGGKMLQAGASWEVAVTHPGGNPLALLADALVEADLYDREEEHVRENLLATLSRSHFGLVEAVKQSDLGAETNFLLVVDQFEEIFRFHEAGQTQREMASEFVSVLLEAVAQSEVPIYVVLTMRSDFIGECGQFEGLAEMVNRGEFLIPRLSREQYKRVIEGPIKVAGGQIAPRLLQRLLNDLGQQADQLPCLQHALMRTWDVWAERGDSDALDLDDYQRVGKMAQALSLHADEVYESLASDRQRELCRGMFQALTVQESDQRGIRRPQRLGALAKILEVSSDELRPIIDAYRHRGVTFLMPPEDVELTDQTIIDISHESLMRVWTRLRHWVEEEAQAAGIYRRLSESAGLHAQGKAGLFRDPELGIALAWREAKHPNQVWAERYRPGFDAAMRFLDDSQRASVAEEVALEAARQRELDQARQLAEAQQLRLELQQRSASKLRKLIGGLAVVAAVAGLACVAALVANNRANELAQVATNEAASAMEAKQATDVALGQVESQKTEVENSLAKAERAERVALDAEQRGRHLLYATDMQLAAQLWQDDQVGAKQLRDQLLAHVPNDDKEDLRGFEWYYSQHLVDSSAEVFAGDDAEVMASALTSEGQLVTMDRNFQLRRWDREAAREIGDTLDLAEGRAVGAAALSRDGRLAAIVIENSVRLFETTTGKETVSLASPTPALDLIFSPDGRMLVTVQEKIQWWNTQSGQLIASQNSGITKFPRGLSISADGLTLAASGLRGTYGGDVTIFKLDLGQKKVSVSSQSLGGTRGPVALSPDGQLFATCLWSEGPVSIHETSGFREVVTNRTAHVAPLSAMSFSEDGKRLITADENGMIKVWDDPRTLESPKFTLKGHVGPVYSVNLSADGKQVVSSGADRTARIWRLPQAGVIRALELAGNHFPGEKVRFSPDGLLIAAGEGTQLHLWDAATGKRLRRLSGDDKGTIYSIAFSPDNQVVAAGFGGQDNVSYVVLWDIDSGQRLAELPGTTDLSNVTTNIYSGPVSALEFSPDGKYLVAGFGSPFLFAPSGYATPLKVWDVASRQLIRRLAGHQGTGTSLHFSADGSRLASGNYDGTARIWETKTWKSLQTLQNPGTDTLEKSVRDVALSPDAQTLAMADSGGVVQLWDVATGQLRETLSGHANAVTSVAYSPDGRTLASGSSDGTVRLWNVATSRELMKLDFGDVSPADNYALKFSPDGRQLLFGGGSVAFWSTAPPLWNDPERAAEKLALMRDSAADFRSRIRLFSANVQLHEALARLHDQRPDDALVLTALAVAQAHWHAWREEWAESAEAFDRLVELSTDPPETWLRTDALLRVATALAHQNRPMVAASLLTSGAKRRAEDGLATLTAQNVMAGGFNDELISPLLALINEKLKENSEDAGWLELRGELAGQWSGLDQQVADYTAAIDALVKRPADEAGKELVSLYRRRGNAYVALEQWQPAMDDYAKGITDATTDEGSLSNQARAQAETLLFWKTLEPAEIKSEGGTTLTLQEDGSILASGKNPDQDTYEITAKMAPQHISAIRLEAIPDASLPHNGPGRWTGHGNFHLNEFRVLINGTPYQPEGIIVSFSDPTAKEQYRQIIDGTVDANFWSIYPQAGQRHTAVFATDIELAADETLKLELVTSRASFPQHNLGRFRLSVSDDPGAFANAEQRFAVMKLTDPWSKLAAAYHLIGDQQALDNLLEQRPAASAGIGDLYADDGDWQRAIEICSKALDAQTADGELLSKRANALEHIADWDAAAADWSRAAAASPNGAQLLAEFAQRLSERGQEELAFVQSVQAQRLYEQSLTSDPGNSIITEQLAQLLLGRIQDESVIVPTSEAAGVTWRWTTTQPADEWMNTDFDDSSWQTGPGGFGTVSTSGAVPRTNWTTSDIWLRRSFEYSPEQTSADLAFRYFHDDEAEIYVNGKLGVTLPSWTGAYENKPLDAAAVGALQPGTNTIAVHCHQGSGGQYIDVGLIDVNAATADRSPKIKLAQDAAKLGEPALRLAAAYAVNGDIEQAATWFGKTIDDADSNEARTTIVEELGRHDEVLTAVLRDRPDDLPLQLARARNLARVVTEVSGQTLADDAFGELQEAWTSLDRIFKQSPEPQWTVLEPTELRSEGGATLTLQKDGSILASGENPNEDSYAIVAPSAMKRITAIRLETLRDPSLPSNGPGRYAGNGNFSLTAFRMKVGDVPQKLTEMAVTYSENNQFASVIGSNRGSGYWGIHPRSGEGQTALFEANLASLTGDPLTFELRCSRRDVVQHNLGRFRLSVTDQPNAFANGRFHFDSPDIELAEVAAALGQGYAQRGEWTKATTFFERAIELADDQPVKQKIIERALVFDELLEGMIKRFAEDGQFQAAAAQKYFFNQGRSQLALASRDKARMLIDTMLADAPDDGELASQLADLLLIDATADWTALEPIEMRSEGGATLTRLPDNSILASGTNPLGDVYTLVAEAPADRVSVIRLEALTHPSLPADGPGRDEGRDRGNFHMINWEVTSSASGAEVLPIQMSRAVADYAVNHIPISVREWNVGGGGGSRSHTAVYLLQEPVDFEQRVQMQFRMEFSANSEWPLQNLGRFRLSVSSDADAFEQAAKRFEVLKLTDPWSRLALAYYLDGDATAAEAILNQHPQAATVLGDQYAARQDWKKAIDMYSRTITAETSDPELLLKRATAYERVEDWDAAAADMSRTAVGLLGNANQHELAFETFKKAGRWGEAITFGWMLVEKNPDDKYVWLRLAPVFVLAGDADGYQEYCRRYVEKFRGLTDAGTADVVCKACLLQPGGIALTELPVDALARALDDGTADSGLLAWFWAGRGLAAYRAGDAAAAVKYAKESQQHSPVDFTLALSLAVQALGQQQLGDVDDARQSVESADQSINRLQRNDADKVHHDLLIPKILLGEAKAAIAGVINPNTTIGVQAAQRTSGGKFLSQAIAEYSKAITDESADLDALSQRARLYEQIRDWDAAAADWSRAAALQPSGGWLLFEFAKRLKASGQPEFAEAQLQEVRRLYEVAIEKDPEDYLAADALMEVLTSEEENEAWTTLTPIQVASKFDATLTRQGDGSILASGSNVSGDAYTVQAEGEGIIAAVRLEVLPDESLPNKGPGRHSSGNFQLAAFELFQVPASTPGRRVPVALRHASASFAYSADNADVSGTIDNQVNKVWHVFGRTGESHWAKFTLQEPITLQRGDRLIVVLRFRDAEGGINLGRFRLSTVPDRSDSEKLALASGPWARLAAAYYLRGEQAAVDRVLEKHPSATAGIGDLMSAEQNWEQAIGMYDKALVAEPTNAVVLSGRAKAFEGLGNSDRAAADWILSAKSDSSQHQGIFDKFKQQERWTEAASVGWMLVEKSPENAMPWLRLAPVLIQAGDMVAYRSFCKRLADRFDETTNADDAAKILKAMLLDRGMTDVPTAYEEAITKSLQDGTTAEGTRHFRWGLLGLLASLRGDAELAVENISKSEALKPNDISRALNLAVLATAQHELGHPEQARQALDEASLLIDRLQEDPNMRIHHDLMIAKILLREAAEAIKGKAAP